MRSSARAQQEIRAAGGEVTFIPTDVTDEANVKDTMARTHAL